VAGDFVIISQTGATIWATSGGEKMRLTSGGSLGIGNSSPSYTLDVTGTGRFTSDLTSLTIKTTYTGTANWNSFGNQLFIGVNGANNNFLSDNMYYNSGWLFANAGAGAQIYFGASAAGSIDFRTAPTGTAGGTPSITNRMTILQGGNVGIGTSSPNYTGYGAGITVLSLATSTADKFSAIELVGNRGTGENQNGNIDFINNNGTATVTSRITALNGTSSVLDGQLTFLTRTAAGSLTERMRINSSGNVGIGTSSPTTFSGNTTLAINNSAGGAVLELQSNGTSALRMATSSSDSALWEPRNVPVLFATNNAERMRITSGGNVGIGTSSPSYQFEVNANTNNFVAMIKNTNSSFGNGIYLYSPNNGSSSTNEGFLRAENGAGIKAYIYTNGSFGSATGTYGALASDIRLKENIIDASSKLEDLLKLRVVNFNLIDDTNKTKQIGFIAQEFKEVFPSLVYQRDTREYDKEGNITKGLEDSLGLSVGMEFAILVKAIQELEARLKTLENK
jgi:hypothetical protein